MIFAALLAVLAAACNAGASVLQRRAARTVPPELGLRLGLIWALVRNRLWRWGITALIAGFVFQAAALSQGGVALVQPALVIELPFTMIILSWAFGTVLDRRSWLAIGVLSAGLGMFLAAAVPGPGRWSPDTTEWVVAAVVTSATVAGLVALAALSSGPLRAAALGVAAGIGFAFTATLIKKCVTLLEDDPGALPVSWPLYAMVFTGLCSVFLLQNSLHSGSLVVAQPALTISDPMAGILYGALMYGEPIRTGPWIVMEAAGAGLLVYGVIVLTRSPIIQTHTGTPGARR
ncbi:DMT family transporter [Nonomuraea jiangxiensis]|uniref:DMT family transporter n=1 Tax=Nonomuraea jiangxiensis TaxID=633440 RepID=UPI00115FB405|nr:DMT family transporter [Nonomuraea jiangxiensis]